MDIMQACKCFLHTEGLFIWSEPARLGRRAGWLYRDGSAHALFTFSRAGPLAEDRACSSWDLRHCASPPSHINTQNVVMRKQGTSWARPIMRASPANGSSSLHINSAFLDAFLTLRRNKESIELSLWSLMQFSDNIDDIGNVYLSATQFKRERQMQIINWYIRILKSEVSRVRLSGSVWCRIALGDHFLRLRGKPG